MTDWNYFVDKPEKVYDFFNKQTPNRDPNIFNIGLHDVGPRLPEP